ncbi:MFS transporter [Pseudonocardia broussonetiae]|uniref:MFS transporter n=1 Tax=Pseudonocardia broussonetiae TaxID=2736640 RepID=A0A6M6JIX7_9PSEU|nr:MFS transporter [Pseudonocardia broussonetiae]
MAENDRLAAGTACECAPGRKHHDEHECGRDRGPQRAGRDHVLGRNGGGGDVNGDESGSSRRTWLGVATLLVGTLLPPLDFFIVNLAIPSIQDELGGGDLLGQQVVAAYAATYAVTLILGGRVGDLHGRQRVFLVGLIGFALASLLCGIAPAPAVLVVGRILQGITAALMAPQSLALIRASLTGRQQSIALGFHGAVFGLAAVLGQSLGGLLVAADVFGLGWRTIFLINLPFAAIAVVGSLVLRAPRPERTELLDVTGAVLLFVGLAGIVVPLVEAESLGWPWWCWVVLVAGAVTLVGFWRRQHRLALDTVDAPALRVRPLVAPASITAPGVRGGLVALLLFYSIAAFFLTFSTYQQAAGRSPFQAGLDILPLGVGFLIGPLTVHRLTGLLPRGVAPLGLGLEAAGFVTFAALTVALGQTAWTAVPLAVIGFGQGLAFPSLIRLTVARVPGRFAGLASGLVSATLQISAALSVAIIGTIHFAVAGVGGQTVAITTTALIIAALLLSAAVLARSVAAVPAVDSSVRAGTPATVVPER